jgi:serine/threonine protein kinase
MAQNESMATGNSGQQPPPSSLAVATEQPASTVKEFNRSSAPGGSRSGATELPPQFGRYRVIKKLGVGGMGTVYLVENTELERLEALKVPHFTDGDDQEIRDRFLREARSAAKLDHPNLREVYTASVQDGIYFMTMRFLQGRPLSDYVGKPTPPRKSAEVVTKLALALDAAHGAGVIHRDLKPSNVMMVSGVGPVVMDFGLAKSFKQLDQKQTTTGAVLGTPAYMPPEQVNGERDRMGPATDVYSLGVILYELLTGRLPFEGTIASIYGQILYVEPPLPSALVPGLSPALDGICRKAMAKDPTQRFPSMKAFAVVLLDYRNSTPDAEGDGKLVPNAGDKAAVFQASTVAPRRRPAGGSDVYQMAAVPPLARPSPPPTPRPGQAATEYLPTGGARKTNKKAGATTDDDGTSRSSTVVVLAVSLIFALMTIAIGGVLWAAGVFHVRTAEGTLVVEVNEPNPDVYVDGAKVTVAWQNGGVKAEVAVKPGTRKVELKKDGFGVYGTEVTLEEHGRTVLVARLDTNTSTPSTQGLPDAPVHAAQHETAEVLAATPDPSISTAQTGTGANAGPTIGGVRPGWTKDAENFTTYAGRWLLEGEELVQTDSNGVNLILFGRADWTDYDVTAEFYRMQGREAAFLILRAMDNDNKIQFCIGGDSSVSCTLDKIERGKYGLIKVQRLPIESQKWYQLMVSVRGNQFNCYVYDNGKLALHYEATDNSFPNGRVGLQTWFTTWRFRNISVTSPDGRVLWNGLPALNSAARAATNAPSRGRPNRPAGNPPQLSMSAPGNRDQPVAAVELLPAGSVWRGTRSYRRGAYAGNTVSYEL